MKTAGDAEPDGIPALPLVGRDFSPRTITSFLILYEMNGTPTGQQLNCSLFVTQMWKLTRSVLHAASMLRNGRRK